MTNTAPISKKLARFFLASGRALVPVASRTARYSAEEVAELVFEGPAPNAAELSQAWRTALNEARAIVEELPPGFIGRCVLDVADNPFRGDQSTLKSELASGHIAFHAGQIGGALPTVRPYPL